MIDNNSTLEDVCFAVSGALSAHGMVAVLTGGSAAALYVPQRYMSYDADFVLEADEPLESIAPALEIIGYKREGRSRIFSHGLSRFTIDFPKGPLAVAGDYIRKTATMTRGAVTLRILTRADCVRDRLAHFYYWNDFTALNAAVSVAAAEIADIDMDLLRRWTNREGSEYAVKFEEFTKRLDKALNSASQAKP